MSVPKYISPGGLTADSWANGRRFKCAVLRTLSCFNFVLRPDRAIDIRRMSAKSASAWLSPFWGAPRTVLRLGASSPPPPFFGGTQTPYYKQERWRQERWELRKDECHYPTRIPKNVYLHLFLLPSVSRSCSTVSLSPTWSPSCGISTLLRNDKIHQRHPSHFLHHPSSSFLSFSSLCTAHFSVMSQSIHSEIMKVS